MVEPTQALLLARAQKGDRAAFGTLVRLHQRRIYGCALHMLGNRAEAEDAVQETFLRAYKALKDFDGRSELATWLYRICINVCLHTIRRRKKGEVSAEDDPRVPRLETAPEDTDADPRKVAERSELYKSLASAMDKLSPSLRTTVILVCLEGMSHAEASEVLGCSEGTIAWRIHEARAQLRASLVRQGAVEDSALPSGRVARGGT